MKRRGIERPTEGWRARIHEVIFEAETPTGRSFDLLLMWTILLSVTAVMLETIESVRASHGVPLRRAEWAFTILFSVEYVVRLACVRRPLAYATSFFGVVDLLAVVPTYLSVLVPGTQSLLVIRALRLLRLFRILKLARYVTESNELLLALKGSRRKIVVFLGWILGLVTILGSLMYVIEGPASGFTSAPRGVYWAIVTMTTVGYGDITPQTTLGQVVSAFVMILGYCIIAVPTGIVSAELVRPVGRVSTEACPACSREGHEPDARHCKHCGAAL